MTTMITFRGKARPRKLPTIPVLVESARLRNRLAAFAEEVRTEVDLLRTELDQRTSDQEEDGHGH